MAAACLEQESEPNRTGRREPRARKSRSPPAVDIVLKRLDSVPFWSVRDSADFSQEFADHRRDFLRFFRLRHIDFHSFPPEHAFCSSDVIKAMRFSAGIIVVRKTAEGWLVLLLRAYANWGFPKGMAERDEKPMATAIRETKEETGLVDLEFRWREHFIETSPYGSPPKIARYYIAETEKAEIVLPVSVELGRPEHDEWRWVNFNEAERLLPPRLHPVLSWARKKLE